jgi:hypothetical protein
MYMYFGFDPICTLRKFVLFLTQNWHIDQEDSDNRINVFLKKRGGGYGPTISTCMMIECRNHPRRQEVVNSLHCDCILLWFQ